MKLDNSGTREVSEKIKSYRINLADLKKLLMIKKKEHQDYKNQGLFGSFNNLDQKLLV